MSVNASHVSQEPLSEAPAPRASARFLAGFGIFVSLLFMAAVLTELGSLAVLAFLEGKPKTVNHVYYQNLPWAEQFWREIHLASPTHFSPWVMWKRGPFQGQYVNVDEHGLRRTVNPACSPQASQVWIFGSSTLWGTGAPDNQTVASFFSQEYSRAIGQICVTNFAEAGWVSLQNVIQLELALKGAPKPPDLVLFLDGFAEIFPVYQSGRTDVHMDYESIRNILEAQSHRSTFAYLEETGTYRFLKTIMNHVAQLKTGGAPPEAPARNFDRLADATVWAYLQNMRLVDALAAGYGFRYIAYWGPALYAGKKPLSRFERQVLQDAPPSFPELCRKTYARMFSEPHERIVDISDVLSQVTGDMYLDATHINPDGNRMVALRMLEEYRMRFPGNVTAR